MWSDERWKSAPRCGAKHISKSKCTKHTRVGACRKSARRCGAKHISKSNRTKHLSFGELLEVEMSKKCTPLWREEHFEVKMYKAHHSRTTFRSWDVEKVHAVVARSTFPSQHVKSTKCSRHFWTLKCLFAWQAQGILHHVKSEQNVRVLWHFQKRWQAWDIWRGSAEMHFPSFSVAGAVQETCSSELLWRPGADFLSGVAFWSIRSSGLLKWFCVTGAALRMTWHHFFVAGAVIYTDGVEKLQNTLVRGRQLCTQLSLFEGHLAELLRFWCCQVQKLRKSRRIASFWILQIER